MTIRDAILDWLIVVLLFVMVFTVVVVAGVVTYEFLLHGVPQ